MASGDKWMLEPATGKFRAVESASGGAGTGINGGDYQYVTPARYRAPVSRGGGGMSYRFHTSTTAGDPGAGKLRFNHTTPASVTAIYIDDLDDESGMDCSAIWATLASGDVLLIRQRDDPGVYLLVSLDSAATDNTGYFTLAVTVEDSGTLPASFANLSVSKW